MNTNITLAYLAIFFMIMPPIAAIVTFLYDLFYSKLTGDKNDGY